MDDKQIEELKKQFEKLQESAGFTPDEDFEKEFEDIINLTFGEDFEQELSTSLMTRKVKIKKLVPDAIFPKYNYPSDSGFDLHSVEEVIIPAFGRAAVPTGLSIQFEDGIELQIRPKSGLALNQGLTILNTPGTVDQGYRGEIKAIIFNTNNTTVTIPKGMKVAQGVLCPVLSGKFIELQDADELDEADRGSNGFGSTGII
jgi:dUTP pyrophosphatase